jgi:FkbM family methyltransferase
MWKLLCFVWNHPLNASGRCSALWRLFSWQLVSRLMPGPIAFPFINGNLLFAARGMAGATGNWYAGLHELQEMAFTIHLLRPGDRFLDIGANIGSYSILAGGGVGAAVISVEPIPQTFTALRRNVLLNGLEHNIRCVQMGLSDSPGVLRFSSGLDCVNHVLASHETWPSIEVAVTTVDDLLGQDVPRLIKIDVEGHELAVLRGARRVLADPGLLAVIMETNGSGARYGVPDDKLVDLMTEHGFGPYGYDPFRRTVTAPTRSHGNTIFLRDRVAVEDIVRDAPRFRLVNGTI